jgi:hypothetical protein
MRAFRLALLAAVVLSLVPGPAWGAEVGFEIGYCRSTQDFDCRDGIEYDTDPVGKFRFGLLVEFALSPKLSLDTGVHYVPMGMEYKWEFYESSSSVSYISVPLVLRARLLPSTEDVSPYATAGPRMDILLWEDADPWFESIYEEFTRVGFGADLAVGVEVGNGRLELRHSETFTDARPDDDTFIIKNRAQSIVYALLLPPMPKHEGLDHGAGD